MWWKKLLLAAVVLAALALAWRFLWAMPAAPLSPAEFVGRYDYSRSAPESLVFTPVGERRARFSFVGYQGDTVHGYIEWPATASAATPAPVLIGISAMGHSAQRWWQGWQPEPKPVYTDREGIARLIDLGAGAWTVTVEASGLLSYETRRVPLGRYRGLHFGLVQHPQGASEVYVEGSLRRSTPLARDGHGPRAILNAVERLINSAAKKTADDFFVKFAAAVAGSP